MTSTLSLVGVLRHCRPSHRQRPSGNAVSLNGGSVDIACSDILVAGTQSLHDAQRQHRRRLVGCCGHRQNRAHWWLEQSLRFHGQRQPGEFCRGARVRPSQHRTSHPRQHDVRNLESGQQNWQTPTSATLCWIAPFMTNRNPAGAIDGWFSDTEVFHATPAISTEAVGLQYARVTTRAEFTAPIEHLQLTGISR